MFMDIKLADLEQEFFKYLKDPPFRYPYQLYTAPRKKPEYKSKVSELIYQKSKIPPDKIMVIEKILSDCRHIYLSLMPLYEFGIHFDLILGGGAVRDLLLGQHDKIKDLDIIVRLDIAPSASSRVPGGLDLQEAWGFDPFSHKWFAQNLASGAAYSTYGYKHSKHKISSYVPVLRRIYDMVQFLLSKKNNFEHCYPPFQKTIEQAEPEFMKSEYLSKNLNGVLKINTPALNFPVDILLTHVHMNNFIQGFDFNLCKASISLINMQNSMKKEFLFPANASEFLKNYVPETSFLTDIFNQTLSIDMDYRNVTDIEHSLNTHLPRLLAKYPDYKVNFQYVSDNDQIPQKKEKDSLILHYNLNQKITVKDKPVSKKTIKI